MEQIKKFQNIQEFVETGDISNIQKEPFHSELTELSEQIGKSYNMGKESEIKNKELGLEDQKDGNLLDASNIELDRSLHSTENIKKFMKKLKKELKEKGIEILKVFFENIEKCKEQRGADLKIEDIVNILEINSAFDFRGLSVCRQSRGTQINIENVLNILEINPSFGVWDLFPGDFYHLGECKEQRGEEITIDNVLTILEKNPDFSFQWFLKCKEQWGEEITIDNVLIILEINPDFDFFGLFFLCKKNRGVEITIENVLTILEKNPNFDFGGLGYCKRFGLSLNETIKFMNKIVEKNPDFNFFGLSLSIEDRWSKMTTENIIGMLEKNPNFDFYGLSVCKEFGLSFHETVEFIYKILENNTEFDYYNLLLCRKKRGTEITMEKALNILENNPNFNFESLYECKKFGLSLNETVERINRIQKTSKNFKFNFKSKNLKMDEIINILTYYPNFDFSSCRNYNLKKMRIKRKIGRNREEPNYNRIIWKSFTEYIEINNPKIRIGKKDIAIGHQNIMSGIYNLAYQKNHITPPKDRGETVDEYQILINDFLNQNEETPEVRKNTDVFFARVNTKKSLFDDPFYVIFRNRSAISDLYSNRYGSFTDLMDQGLNSTEIINKVKEWRNDENNKGKKLILDIGAHGGKKGTASYGKDNRTKEQFQELFAMDDDRIIINITSCYSGKKLSKNPYETDKASKLFLDSGNQPSTINGEEVFLEAYTKGPGGSFCFGDRNEDGDLSRAEAKIYQMINYSDSVTPFFWQRSEDERVRLSYNLDDQGGIIENRV